MNKAYEGDLNSITNLKYYYIKYYYITKKTQFL